MKSASASLAEPAQGRIHGHRPLQSGGPPLWGGLSSTLALIDEQLARANFLEEHNSFRLSRVEACGCPELRDGRRLRHLHDAYQPGR